MKWKSEKELRREVKEICAAAGRAIQDASRAYHIRKAKEFIAQLHERENLKTPHAVVETLPLEHNRETNEVSTGHDRMRCAKAKKKNH